MKKYINLINIEQVLFATIVLLFLVEAAFPLTPLIQYIIIITSLLLPIISLVVAAMFRNKEYRFYEQFVKNNNKVLFYYLCLFGGILWVSAIYSTFFMHQGKNKLLLIILWVLALLNTPNSFLSKMKEINDFRLIKTIGFYVALMLILITMIISYQYLYLMWVRLLSGVLILIMYTCLLFKVKGGAKNESN
ncbi:MAG: hypothetical protein RBQ97_08710 [Acholeplasma sp.]|nr:hypothetical protein [Acholeplasma sp.]